MGNNICIIDSDEQEKLFRLYTLAELSYQKHFENRITNKEILFSFNWYNNNDYKAKIEIIAEAIAKDILIENTMKYREFIKSE